MSNNTVIAINGADDDLKSAQDIFFDDVALPANTTPVVSEEFQVNDGTSGVEIVIDYGAIATGTDKDLTVTLTHSNVKGAAASGTALILLALDGDAGNIAADKFRYVPDKDIGLYGVITLTAGADISEANASVYINSIPNRNS